MVQRGKCLVTGLLAGVANGLFGAGGGLVLVPLFLKWLDLKEKQAFATSVAVVLPMSVAALVTYGLTVGVELSPAMPYLVGGLAGGVLAGRLLKGVSVVWLRRGFGALLVYAGVRAVLLL